MGLLTKIFNDASDSEFKLAQDLVAIAMADGEISVEERKVINDICQKEGIPSETVNDCLYGIDDGVNSSIPADRREKMAYLSKLVRVMGVDGNSANMEIFLLEVIASKLGVSHMELLSVVLMTATHTVFSGNIGSKTLSSFLHNVIDPKGKTLHDNQENLRHIFDTIAKNVPCQQNAEEDRAAFVAAMNSAIELLMENTLLCNEFHMIGIDFETVLKEERERAVKRWIC